MKILMKRLSKIALIWIGGPFMLLVAWFAVFPAEDTETVDPPVDTVAVPASTSTTTEAPQKNTDAAARQAMVDRSNEVLKWNDDLSEGFLIEDLERDGHYSQNPTAYVKSLGIDWYQNTVKRVEYWADERKCPDWILETMTGNPRYTEEHVLKALDQVSPPATDC